MNIFRLWLLIGLISLNANCQTCTYENLSKIFNFKVIPIPKKEDIITINVEITEKENSKKVQTVTIECDGFYLDSFDDCKKVKSYSTGINDKLPIGDENDSGNFIVADFNFDGIEDFAVKRDPGGNGGPLYAYFLQGDDKVFYKSSYLSNTVVFFPIEINPKKRTLTTYLHANAYQKNRRIFKYNPKTKKWKCIYDKLE